MRPLLRIALPGALVAACAGETPPATTCEDDPSLCGGAPDAAARRDVPGATDRALARDTDLVGIELLPANPTLDATASARPAVTFRVMGRQRDGRTREFTGPVRFSLDAAALGAIVESTGAFTGSGLGGTSRVRVVSVDGSALSGDTTLTVNLRHVVLGDGVSMAERDAMAASAPVSMPTVAPLVDYPLEGAVMPRNVFPPDVMWTARHPNARPTDLVRIALQRERATFETVLRASAAPRANLLLAAPSWAAFAGTSPGSPITLTVSVSTGAMVIASPPRTFRTVDGVIGGSVYYWSPAQRRLVRLDVDRAAQVNFLPSPGDTCIGCHAVSRDGQRLAGFLEGRGENLALYDLTRNLTANPAPTIATVRYSVRRCTSFNQDRTRIVSGDCGANVSRERFSLIDAASGAMVNAAAGSPGDGFDPEWSPDGALIAYTDRSENLTVTPAMGGDRFGAARLLHTASSTPGGAIDWHPTWTPDSRWIAYQHGNTRRTAFDMGRGAQGDLWMIARDGGAPVRLTRANGDAATNSYRPVFSPFDSGGYFWLLFTSTRPYGNATAGARNTKLIWVAAVRDRPDGRNDPSEVAYFLSGQERVTSLSPYWTPAPCVPNGQACSVGGDCCSGACDPDSAGRNVCAPPRNACRARGEMCSGASDCCMGLECNAGRICDLPGPG